MNLPEELQPAINPPLEARLRPPLKQGPTPIQDRSLFGLPTSHTHTLWCVELDQPVTRLPAATYLIEYHHVQISKRKEEAAGGRDEIRD